MKDHHKSLLTITVDSCWWKKNTKGEHTEENEDDDDDKEDDNEEGGEKEPKVKASKGKIHTLSVWEWVFTGRCILFELKALL